MTVKKHTKDILNAMFYIIIICIYIMVLIHSEIEARENTKNGICTCGATEYCIGN